MLESRFAKSMLLDFYGELLTEKQRECCEMYFNEDLSLSEIAEQKGVSRQAVWDNIRHGEAALEEIEEKTSLAARFQKLRDGMTEVRNMLADMEKTEEIIRLSDKIESMIEAM